ncbi:Gp49 family protein [Mongoliitalea daihaiensis]|uniref:Gp49 family protein n=1 Tax=Mongoliitalea daihaiensis TaxID=2782006 RepID=UPI001EEF007F|nr:Gp49 family protein [Mongoliitalea daihaiensis]
MNKVTKEHINSKINTVEYRKLTDKITHCIITMSNGFQVTGESAVVDPSNFDEKIGREIAFDNAFKKLWELEGYLLQEKLKLKNDFERRNPKHLIDADESLKYKAISEKELNELSQQVTGLPLMKWVNISDLKNVYPVTPEEAFDKQSEKYIAGCDPVSSEANVHISTQTNARPLPSDPLLHGNPHVVNKQPYGKSGVLDNVSLTTTQSQSVFSWNPLTKEMRKFDMMLNVRQREKEKWQGHVVQNKSIRKKLDELIQELKEAERKSPERSTSITKLQEAVMWLGMDLKALGEANPYPESKNPTNTTVEPTADGLKL